ncbi:MAG: hypothetical protein MUC47_10805 [Candidatus Kapabacteria bacterium]|jgi:hypothetical protein|nr:hypothetical protein [Candidatus Kapabacteria bacterium]
MTFEPTLRERAAASPTKRFAVVVVIDEAQETPAAVNDLQVIEGLDGVLTGTLTGSEIVTLLKDPSVLSVDEDSEQELL